MNIRIENFNPRSAGPIDFVCGTRRSPLSIWPSPESLLSCTELPGATSEATSVAFRPGAFGQAVCGNIVGTITDSSGANA